jgi:PadR family transcriptional regulator, regulatory protein PadR
MTVRLRDLRSKAWPAPQDGRLVPFWKPSFHRRSSYVTKVFGNCYTRNYVLRVLRTFPSWVETGSGDVMARGIGGALTLRSGQGDVIMDRRASTVCDTVVDMNEVSNGGTSPTDIAFAADLLRGHTDAIVLEVLRRGDRYGFEIYKAIRDRAKGYEIKEATLYATYRRLERDGLVEAYWGDETQGGRRKYYRITDAGRAVHRRNLDTWVATRGVIDAFLDVKSSAGADSKGTNHD